MKNGVVPTSEVTLQIKSPLMYRVCNNSSLLSAIAILHQLCLSYVTIIDVFLPLFLLSWLQTSTVDIIYSGH